MSDTAKRSDPAGCATCWPPGADAAWEARDARDFETRVVDESHYGVTVHRCGACGQRFVSIFTERIDWVNGEDPQEWREMPVTDAEAGAVVAAGLQPEAVIEALAPGRRSLLHWAPGGDDSARWVSGLAVGPHD